MSLAVRLSQAQLGDETKVGIGLVGGLVEVRATAVSRLSLLPAEERTVVAGIVDDCIFDERKETLDLRLRSGPDNQCVVRLWGTGAWGGRALQPAVGAMVLGLTKNGDLLGARRVLAVDDDVIVAIEAAGLHASKPEWSPETANRVAASKLAGLRKRREKEGKWSDTTTAVTAMRRDRCWACGSCWDNARCSSWPVCGGTKKALVGGSNHAGSLELVWHDESLKFVVRTLPAPRGEPPLHGVPPELAAFVDTPPRPLSDLAAVRTELRHHVAAGRLRGLREPPASVISAATSSAVIQEDDPGIPDNLMAILLPFQVDGVRFALKKRRAYIADDMGLGKTLQGIAYAAALRAMWPLLIICPAGCRSMWADQIEKYIPDLSPAEICVVTCGNDAPAPPPAKPPDVLIISFHMLARLRELRAEADVFQFGVVIIDEAHVLATPTSKVNSTEATQTTVALGWVRKAPNVLLLSGTPAISRPLSMFAALDALLPRRPDWLRAMASRDRKLEFLRGWCGARKVSYGMREGLGFDSKLAFHDELNAVLRHFCMIRRLKCDVADQLPPLSRSVARVALSEIEEGDDFHATGRRKVPAAAAWIVDFLKRDTRRKLVIFAHHIAVLDGIQTALERHRDDQFLDDDDDEEEEEETQKWVGLPAERIDGAATTASREKSIRLFHRERWARVVLVSVTAGGVGIDLSAASYAVFVESVGLAASWIRQAEDRLHRRGQQNPVHISYLLGDNAWDDKAWPVLHAELLSNTTVFNGATNAESFLVHDVLTDDTTTQDMKPTTTKPSPPILLLQKNDDVDDDDCSEDDLDDWRWAATDLLSQDSSSSSSSEEDDDMDVDDVLFEVSPHTGRIHVVDPTGPRSNVDLADLEVLRLKRDAKAAKIAARKLPPSLRSGKQVQAAWNFAKAWERLTSRQKAALVGVPAKPPLAVAAARAMTATTHGTTTTRRYVPISEVIHTNNFGSGDDLLETVLVRVAGREKLGQPPLPRLLNRRDGAAKCLVCPKFYQCAKEAFSKDAASIILPSMAGLFCSKQCREAYKATTSGTGLREIVFARDAGVCASCGADSHTLVERLKALKSLGYGRQYAEAIKLNKNWSKYPPLLRKLCENPRDGLAWEADHINRVADGGGESSVENCQTLCVPCHKDKTRGENSKKSKRGADENPSHGCGGKKPRAVLGPLPDNGVKKSSYDDDDDDSVLGGVPNPPRLRPPTTKPPQTSHDDDYDSVLDDSPAPLLHRKKAPPPEDEALSDDDSLFAGM